MNNIFLLALLAFSFTFFSCSKNSENSKVETEVKDASSDTKPEEASGPTADPGKPPYTIADSSKIIKTASGLRYYVVQQGQGNVPKVGQTIMANYHGMLLDGKVFDSSFNRGQPFSTKIGVRQVIQGWDEAFTTLKVGTKAVLIIPSDLGYGPTGNSNIPGGATLVFHVELLGANE